MFQLRQYQIDDISNIHKAFRDGHKRVIYRADTGSGKTVVFNEIARRTSEKGTRVGIVVHRRELLLQTVKKLERPCGIINANFSPDLTKKLQVATAQTLVNRLDKYKFDLLIFDEAHHTQATTWRNILAANPNAYVIGPTATPCRLDGRGLGELFDYMVESVDIRYLIENGYLARPVVYGTPSPVDVSGLRKAHGDFAKGDLEARASKPVITGSAVAHYRRLAEGKAALVSCVSVKHAYMVAEQFRQAGYNFVAVDGKTPDAERDKALRDLENRVIQGICYCDLFCEGVDVPLVEVGIMLRPTESLGLHRQIMGRVLRMYPGKTEAIILDHAGNCVRNGREKHGLPDKIIAWSLDGGAPKRERETADAVRQCPKCYYAHIPAPVCPNCGFVYETKAREIPHVDGELQRIEAAKIAKKREVGKARDLEALKRIEKERGYKPGWANIVWSARNKKKKVYNNESARNESARLDREYQETLC